MATHSRRPRHSTRTNHGARRTSTEAHATELLLLEELHEHLPVGLLINDAVTLETLHAKPPLPGFADHNQPHDGLVASRNDKRDPNLPATELARLVEEVAATGRRRHLLEFRHDCLGQEPRWWSATVHRIDTDRWGPVVVTLAVELTDQVRARQLLEERERRNLALRQTIAAVPGDDLVSSVQQVADALVAVLAVHVAALRLLDADGKLHLVAASGLRSAETRRLALEPITVRRLETMIQGSRDPLGGSLGFQWVEMRWLEARDDRIGMLAIGARSKERPSKGDLALLDAAVAQLATALETIERSPRFLRSRSLEMARLSADEHEAAQTRGTGLRPRELAILRLYGEGLGTDQIAELLVLSPHTVRTHVRNARRHLGVGSRGAALDLLEAIDADPVI